MLFDDVATHSYFFNDQTLVFINPPSDSEKAAIIKILFEGGPIHYNMIYFFYKDYKFKNLLMTPFLGPELGHTLITIKNDFPFKPYTNHYIRFEDVTNIKNSFQIAAFITNDYILNCLTYKTKSGVFSVKIIFDNVYSSDQEKLYYIFYRNIHIQEITPRIIFSNSLCKIKIKIENSVSNQLYPFYENAYNKFMNPIINKYFDIQRFDFQSYLQIKINDIYSHDKSSNNLKFNSDNEIILFKDPDYKLKFPLEGIENLFFISYNRQEYEYSKDSIMIYDFNNFYIEEIFPIMIPMKLINYEYREIKFKVYGLEMIQGKYPLFAKFIPLSFQNINSNSTVKDIIKNVFYYNNNEKYFFMNYPRNVNNLLIDSNQYIKFSLEIYFNECAKINNNFDIIFYPDFVIDNIYPLITEAFSEDLITIKGQNVQNLKSLECVFIDYYDLIDNDENIIPALENISEIKNKMYSKGIYIDHNTFQCPILNFYPGVYFLFFTLNRYDFVQHSIIHSIEIKDIIKLNFATEPLYSYNYLDKIKIVGENFFDSNYLNCLYEYNQDFINYDNNIIFMKNDFFEKQKIYFTSYENLEVKGYFIDSENIYCDFPDFKFQIDSPYKIRVNFYQSKINYSDEHVDVFIYNSLPNGLAIDTTADGKNKVIKCPKGKSCNNENSAFGNKVEMNCSYGYFNDEEGNKFCKFCPVGFFCNHEANINPIPCSSGDYCFKRNSNSINDECMKGFICENKELKNIFIVGLETKISSPIKCPIGYFCEGGQTYITDGNMNKLPQKCLSGFICPYSSTQILGSGACPAGFYCINNYSTGIICPPRFFCNDRGNIKPNLCPKGTYNDLYGQVLCKRCPEGYYCPIEGLLKPEPCSIGYICDEKDLIIPYNMCPAGFICLDSIKINFDYRFCRVRDEMDICDLDSGNFKDYIIESNFESTDVILEHLGYEEFVHTNICCYSEAGVIININLFLTI